MNIEFTIEDFCDFEPESFDLETLALLAEFQ